MSNKGKFPREEFEEDLDSPENNLVKKREKKRKSREEKGRDRKIVFWVLILVMLITIIFWLKSYVTGGVKRNLNRDDGTEQQTEKGFFVKYEI